ncbi:MAG: sensor histidine kinase [Pseudonocardia sp.]|nr:sensor histidine kinase [Pseudonocardia sp.]
MERARPLGPVRAPSARSLRLALAQLGLTGLLLVGVEVVLVLPSETGPAWVLVLFPAVGLIYLAAGVLAWVRRPSNRMGPLLAAGALFWLAAALVNTGQAGLVGVGLVAATVPLAVVVHVLLAFPSGRLPEPGSRTIVAAAYVVTVVLQAPLYLFAGTPDAPEELTIAARPDLVALGGTVQSIAGAAVVAATAVVLARRLRAAAWVPRRVLLPLYAYGIVAVLGVPISANVLAPLLGLDPVALAVLQLAVLAGVPVAFAAGVLLGGFARAGEIEELGAWLGTEDGRRADLGDALAATLGDGSLRLAFWAPERDGYVDADGVPVELPAPGADRAAVRIERAGRRIGAISYDPTLIADPELVATAGRVVAIALDGERLTAELRASRESLVVSRARIAEAGDRERRRIAQDLHDGLQARLITLALRSGWIAEYATADPALRDDVAEVRAGLDAAITDLRRLVHGVLPALLIECGLAAAVEDLADQMPVAVQVDLSRLEGDLAPAVESTAYFLVSEALANAVKHSGAEALTVYLARDADRLRVEVRDDGIGGATPSAGTGLRGITDRVDVLGGRLTIDSPPGRGTVIRAELPCGS